MGRYFPRVHLYRLVDPSHCSRVVVLDDSRDAPPGATNAIEVSSTEYCCAYTTNDILANIFCSARGIALLVARARWRPCSDIEIICSFLHGRSQNAQSILGSRSWVVNQHRQR